MGFYFVVCPWYTISGINQRCHEVCGGDKNSDSGLCCCRYGWYGWLGGCSLRAISSAVTYGVTDGDLKAAARSGAVAFSTTYMMSGMDGKAVSIRGVLNPR